MNTKYIFMTGGVVSSVGKGLTSAALGRLLKEMGFRVAIQKLDPYINVDPGTMSPYQHGEVYVLNDGSETDLDLGHYERFLDENLSKVCNVTTGQVYAKVIAKERRGDYLGGTIQVIPHITNQIKESIIEVTKELDAEIVIVEVGGTVGDIESLPFLEALRQMKADVGPDNCCYMHVTWLPYIGATSELKTKPTQHSVRELRSIGITPDIIIARADHSIEEELQAKISQFCDVKERAVIPMQTASVMYELPLLLEQKGVGELTLEILGLEARKKPQLRKWEKLVSAISSDRPICKIALVGKYVELHDAYISVRESLVHAGMELGVDVEIEWINSVDLEHDESWNGVKSADGIIVPGGFGHRGIEGKINAAQYAREKEVPYLGLCLGMQLLVIEMARNVLNFAEANSTEFNEKTPHAVIDLMPEQREIEDKGATMRLGVYPCELESSSKAGKAYDEKIVDERHRHRYEFNNEYREKFEESGLLLSGISPDNRLVEIVELAEHPFMLGTQFHPEFLSRPTKPHPLFVAFVAACIERASINVKQI
jgi:CTP synthase